MNEPDDLEPLAGDNLSAFDAAPQVGARAQPWALPLGIAGAAVLGLLVFSALNANRMRNQAPVSPPPAERPPPSPAPAPSPPPAYVLEPPELPQQLEGPVAPAPSPLANEADARLRAPALIVDLSEAGAQADGTRSANAQGIAAAAGGDALSGDERFAARLGGAGQAARARPMASPQATIPQGAIIAAVLETAINSDLPGYTRALVSRDVRGFDGSAVLVPRGSRLIGQYRAGVALGQSRAFVIWTRLIRPDGVTIELNSPGADALGRAGLEGETDRHFLSRFGGAMLLTLLGAATNAATDDNNTQVIIGVARGGGDAAAVALNEEINISPTIRVAQGTPIRIFVSRDLDFSSVASVTP